MKKILFLSLLLSAVFCLSSCGNDSDDNSSVAYIENPVLGKVAVDITNTEATPEWLSTMIKKMDADKDTSLGQVFLGGRVIMHCVSKFMLPSSQIVSSEST
jgi:hypothetical protein